MNQKFRYYLYIFSILILGCKSLEVSPISHINISLNFTPEFVNPSPKCNETETENQCWMYENGTWVNYSNKWIYKFETRKRKWCGDSYSLPTDPCYCPNGTVVQAWAGFECIGDQYKDTTPVCNITHPWYMYENKTLGTYYCLQKCPYGFHGVKIMPFIIWLTFFTGSLLQVYFLWIRDHMIWNSMAWTATKLDRWVLYPLSWFIIVVCVIIAVVYIFKALGFLA